MYDRAVQLAYKACAKTQNHKTGRDDVCIISSSSSFEAEVSRCSTVTGDGGEGNEASHPLDVKLQRCVLRTLRSGDVKGVSPPFITFLIKEDWLRDGFSFLGNQIVFLMSRGGPLFSLIKAPVDWPIRNWAQSCAHQLALGFIFEGWFFWLQGDSK